MADTMKPCPLIFKPIFKPRIWGGRKIHTRFDKPLPPGENFGESWELADLEDDQSVVASGPQQGRTLRELVVEWGDQLLGGIALFEGRFPLLIKYLDAREHLSVQVHPDAKLAAQLGGAVRVKNEAWVVIDAEPDGCIYRGLVDSVTPDQFSKALSDGGVEKLLRSGGKLPMAYSPCGGFAILVDCYVDVLEPFFDLTQPVQGELVVFLGVHEMPTCLEVNDMNIIANPDYSIYVTGRDTEYVNVFF